jgi:hypothetical protein
MADVTQYELQQIEEIANWKSERPSLVMSAYRAITNPITNVFSHVLPVPLVRALIAKAQIHAETHDGMSEMLDGSGVSDFRQLFNEPLETCDRLAKKVSMRSEHAALVEGTVPALGALLLPGVGGLCCAVVDTPILLDASLRSIRRIGHCYGYPLDTKCDRLFVLGILDVAQADVPSERTRELAHIARLASSRESADDSAICLDHLYRSIVDDLPLEAVPLFGEVCAIVLDFAFLHQVDNAARRAFQERWLYDHGKVSRIRPAAISRRRSSVQGVVRISREVSYMGGYSLGFGATFSLELASKGVAALPANPVVDGFRDGATAATRDATKVWGPRRAAAPVSVAPASASDTAMLAPATG